MKLRWAKVMNHGSGIDRARASLQIWSMSLQFSMYIILKALTRSYVGNNFADRVSVNIVSRGNRIFKFSLKSLSGIT